MSEWKNYIKKVKQPMRPYVEGEDLEAQDISIWGDDIVEVGGMVARNPENPKDQWYVCKKFFEENYILAE